MDGLFCLKATHLNLLPNQTPSHRTTTTSLPKPPLTSLFAGNCNCHHVEDAIPDNQPQNENWVLRLLQVRSLWKPEASNHRLQERDENDPVENYKKDHDIIIDEDCDACRVDDDDNNDKLVDFDKNSFSELLSTVSLAEARLYAKMAYLGSLSYTIPKIKLGNLLKRHRLCFVTSSLEKKPELAANIAQPSSVADDDLNSACSSPCEWFICDDNESNTRYFVIQGSESLASWQANLLFEPIQFEAQVDVIVHRGIYEAAKVVYEQMLPRVHEHLQRHGNGTTATIRLTGHSLGGSLSLLINLMLLIRGQVPRPSCLLPVITFGAPWVMCGGDRLLHKLGLPRNHLQGITTHRDIVPRAFSCNYPTRVADLLKAVNGNFRNHPCLNNQNVLYAPMGELLILQPDAKVSPSHELLPSGSGLYVLRCDGSKKQTIAAQSVFLNTPHPLHMILSEHASILRDHDVETYLTSIRSVIRQQLMNRLRRRRQRRQWVAKLGDVMMRWVKESEVKVLRLFDDGLKVVLVPAKLLIIETYNWMIKFGN